MSVVPPTTPPDVMDLFKRPVPSTALKRNTACHQCRKRKLKCDAKRPCATCLRSHAYAVAHATEDKPAPPYPDCTYDEGAEEPEDEPNGQKYTKLENRISELETMLRKMTLALHEARSASGADARQPSPSSMTSASTPSSSGSISSQPVSSETDTSVYTSGLTCDSIFSSVQPEIFLDPSAAAWGISSPEHPQEMSLDDWGVLPSVNPTQPLSEPQYNPLDFALATTTTQAYTGVSGNLEMMRSGWPQTLPNPEITRHLIHAFFAFFVHAGRVFHGPTFLASLDLPPTDPRFPCRPILHAMCAVGSMFTADIEPTPVHTSQAFPYEIFVGRWKMRAPRPHSFAEQQIVYAKMELESQIDMGEKLFEGVQAQVLITWFFLHQGRWAECFVSAGLCLRYASAIGLSKEEPFKPRPPRKALQLKAEKHGDLLSDPETPTEAEMRRNVFWLAYTLERSLACGSSFALELDDHDICQLLPLRGDYFELGKRVPRGDRQFSHAHDVLLTNPVDQTDSFILYTKTAMLLSRVKTFNTRFRGRYYAGDSEYFPTAGSPSAFVDDAGYDVRESPRFRELDQLVSQFRASWPHQLKDPIQDGIVDPHLYAACVGAHLAQIMLHDPHVQLDRPLDNSVVVLYRATRAILDLVYNISSTSYDVSLLDQLALLGWDKACRSLIEFLRVAIDTKNFEQVFSLHTEICFMHSMMAKAGERMPVAYRYKRVIYDTLAQLCGEQFVEPLPETSYHRPGYVAPSESVYADPAPSSIASLFNNMLTYDGAPLSALNGPAQVVSGMCVF